MSIINFYNVDCMEFMKDKPDKFYDLAIVDPPYGINAGNMNLGNGVGTKNRKWKSNNWDLLIPDESYFKEMFRVSKNQIIWGANYFIEMLMNSNTVIIWDKIQEFSGADFELAWTSFNKPSKAFRMSRVEAYTNQEKIHPTQKPIKLYRWLLKNYANPGDKILDTHGGSFSHAIACDMEGFDLDICEIDTEYFNAGLNRFNNYKLQLTLF